MDTQTVATNLAFARWVRSATFSLTLKDSAIKVLLDMLEWEEELAREEHDPATALSPGAHDPDQYGVSIYSRGPALYLERRGLIRFASNVKNNMYNYVLTEAGTHTARLLRCAGFQPDHKLR